MDEREKKPVASVTPNEEAQAPVRIRRVQPLENTAQQPISEQRARRETQASAKPANSKRPSHLTEELHNAFFAAETDDSDASLLNFFPFSCWSSWRNRKEQKERERYILDARLEGLEPDQQRLYRRSLRRLRRDLSRHIKGKPTRPASLLNPLESFANGVSKVIHWTLLVVLAGIILLSGVGGGMLLGYIATTEPVSPSLFNAGSQTSRVLDANGQVISISTGSENIDRELVKISDVKDTYIDEAFKSIEDERFDSNIGIDPRRIASAVISALLNGGTAQHGGSTITQQTVKLLTGDNSVSAQRKVQEWYRAILLKRELSNDQIMELYLNLVPMANSYVGIESASKAYFGKHAKDLSLSEASFLAGIPKGPSIYNPRTERGLRNALRRQRMVLKKMYALNYITEAQYKEALNSELKINRESPQITGTSINSYFTEYAYRQAVKDLVDQKGYSREAASRLIHSGGVSIYTTLNPEVQNLVDQTFAKQNLFAHQPSRYEGLPDLPQAGMVVIDNRTGAVVAMGGGRGRKEANLVINRAVDIERQPGSSIKLLNVYAPAIELGQISGSTMVVDEEVHLDLGNPQTPYPVNAYPGYRGGMTIRNAIRISNNVPAAKVLMHIGLKNSLHYLNEVGINRLHDSAQISMAMGGFEQGMNPLEMAAAYATFANAGNFVPPYAYTKVVSSDGQTLLENLANYHSVYTPQTAYQVLRLMEEPLKPASAFWYEGSAYAQGPIHNAKGEYISTGAKTGTTDNDMDKWFVALTPYYTAAVWYGLDIPRTIPNPDNPSAREILWDVFKPLHANLPAMEWPQPNGITSRQVDIFSGLLASDAYAKSNPRAVTTEYYTEGSPLIPTAYRYPGPAPVVTTVEARGYGSGRSNRSTGGG